MPALTDSEKRHVSQTVKHARRVAKARQIARIIFTIHPTDEALARRTEYEKSLGAWLKYYMPETFPDEWGQEHLNCIAKLEMCIRNGGSFALAMPRGSGKSAIGKGACVFAALSGLRSYIVPIGATDPLANDYLEFIKNQIGGDNERLKEDYPDCVNFFDKLEGKAIKANNQLDFKLRPTGIGWRVKGLTFPIVHMPDDEKLYPYSGARIECRGITAAMKGMAKTVANGRIIRPDFVLPDDVQTEEDAESPTACDKIERKIMGTVMGLAGPRKRIACFMPCTCVTPGDVSDRFLDRKRHPEFQGQRNPMFVKWPAGVKWPEGIDGKWQEYFDFRRNADDGENGKLLATAFYQKNRAAMDKGAVVSWPSRVRGGELSAIETGMNLLFEMGESKFFAEMQNDPKDPVEESRPYTLTPGIIMSRVTKRKMWEKPDWVTRVYASSDVNPSYALSTVVVGFGEDQSAAVLWWGVHRLSIPGDTTRSAFDKLLYAEIEKHGQELSRIAVRPEGWAVDAGGGQFDPVVRFAVESRLSFAVYALRGAGAKQYKAWGRTLSGKPFEQAHNCVDRKDGRTIRWSMWNADYWKEVHQRAWLGEVGSPGSISLYAGNHSELAAQICNEKLAGKGEVGGLMMWNYVRAPGKNDFGDALAQCYALAALQGIGTGGKVDVRGGRKKYRQADFTRR
jgi:hypothetical protein